MRLTDEKGDRCVVIHADPVIHIAPDLLALAKDPDAPYVPGAMKVDGDRIEFGVDGEGIGRVVYRLQVYNANRRWYVAERVDPGPRATRPKPTDETHDATMCADRGTATNLRFWADQIERGYIEPRPAGSGS